MHPRGLLSTCRRRGAEGQPWCNRKLYERDLLPLLKEERVPSVLGILDIQQLLEYLWVHAQQGLEIISPLICPAPAFRGDV